ncbi:hypothetical protein DSM106972_077660 [Dulcicalothrix desertica PCC 7102]|uniref:DUF6816 domain-containing protein n=1 Tax=Dulcicalothrix desertica PCC 7102 TaxID=232991 RepID=A0A433UZN9_9CYAN|nr:hypothetical protein [Dulcicalothrix desertica]RUS99324.1 hypothetical protein DSM106972_077660 [Dulcicalothrix desertica PCC 7102]TWH49987.1 hypothetical protein CAL7102_04263 [Dulcicalothrix desertica PCC 7102]
MRKLFILSFCLVVGLLVWNGEAKAGELAQRLANFPQWQRLTTTQPANGDLIYPTWMQGEWLVKSTLVDLAAPLAPDIITPGFEGNRQYLNQPVSFKVKFVPEKTYITGSKLIPRIVNKSASIVADRAYNSLSLARAYLGEDAVISVKVDPSPNRQITTLKNNLQLVSIVTTRAIEITPDDYITSEVFQQLFKGAKNPYFNIVESTTAYSQQPTPYPAIVADQVTAVYLSPQDPNYFKAGTKPVALYKYKLEFHATNNSQEKMAMSK